MKTVWLKGLEDDQVLEIKGLFSSSKRLRERLLHIIEEKGDNGDKRSRSLEEYENPNWGFKQADSIGYLRALDEISSILKD